MQRIYSNLSKAQRKYAVILAKYRPNRDPSGVITSSFVRELHHELLAKRDQGGEKIGWPRWVFVENATGASEGFVPFPTPEEITEYNNKEQFNRKTLQEDEPQVQLTVERSITISEFEEECLAAGIDF